MDKQLSLKYLKNRISMALLIVGLFLMTGWNLWQIQDYYRDIDYRKLTPNRAFPPAERSADMVGGGEYREFVHFLHEIIPPERKVVIPPENVRFFLNSGGLMQYFLYPREILHRIPAGGDANLQAADTYILYQPGFPDEGFVPAGKQLIVFNDDFGIYIPQ